MVPYSTPQELFFLLLAGHAIADFAIQTEFVATNKNRHVRLKYSPEVRAKMEIIWPHLLTAHSLHHGLFVFLITGNLLASCLEVVIHWITDFGKCERWYGFHADQAIHVLTKALWTYLITTKVI